MNGTARLRDETEFSQQREGRRKWPKLVSKVVATEAYLHCAKALMRSKFWAQETQIERSALPSLNQIIHAQMGLATEPEAQADMVQRYQKQITDEQGVR